MSRSTSSYDMTFIVVVEAACRKMSRADFIEALGSARTRVLCFLVDCGSKFALFFARYGFRTVRLNCRSGLNEL